MQNTLNLEQYFSEIQSLLSVDGLHEMLERSMQLIADAKDRGGKIMVVGNGGSAGIASHAAIDFSKQAKVPAMTLHDVALVTALSNDYGYEYWVQKTIEYYSKPNDLLIVLSVSGESPNLVNGVNYALQQNLKVISFTGKKSTNTIKQLSTIGFFVNSKSYNIVEGLSMMWLTTIVDMFVGKSVYEVS